MSVHFVEFANDTVVDARSYSPRISYAPFPAQLSLAPVSRSFTFSTFRGPLSAAIVETVEPLAHIRRDFEIGGLRLGEFEVRFKDLPR